MEILKYTFSKPVCMEAFHTFSGETELLCMLDQLEAITYAPVFGFVF